MTISIEQGYFCSYSMFEEHKVSRQLVFRIGWLEYKIPQQIKSKQHASRILMIKIVDQLTCFVPFSNFTTFKLSLFLAITNVLVFPTFNGFIFRICPFIAKPLS